MDYTFRGTAIVVLVTLFPLMITAGTPAAETSGIEGVISVSPRRPGPIRKDEPNVGPAPHVEFIVKNGETPVTKFTTDGEGRFRISVPPGHYTVVREDPGTAIGHWRFEADVVAGQMTKVSWTGDSGMR